MVVDDSAFEGEEQFEAILELPVGSSGVILGPQATAMASIQDDDGTQLLFLYIKFSNNTLFHYQR